MGKTLTAVSEALSKPDGAFRDDVLATVWILANYEVWLIMIVMMNWMLTSVDSDWIVGSSRALESVAFARKGHVQYFTNTRGGIHKDGKRPNGFLADI